MKKIHIFTNVVRGVGTPVIGKTARFLKESCKIFEGKFGHIISLKGNEVSSVPDKEVIPKLRNVPPDSQLIRAAEW